MKPRVLVIGGAGYIGAQMVKLLGQAGYAPVVLDDLSNGRREAAPVDALVVGDIAPTACVPAACVTLMRRAPTPMGNWVSAMNRKRT